MGHIDWTVQGTKHPCKFNSLSKIELCDQAIGEKIGSGSKQKNGGKLLVPEPRRSRLSRTVPCSERRWCPGTESNRHVPCGTRDFKLRRFAGVSEPQAKREPAAEILSGVEGSHCVMV